MCNTNKEGEGEGEGEQRESVVPTEDAARDTYVLGGSTKSVLHRELQPLPYSTNSTSYSNNSNVVRTSTMDNNSKRYRTQSDVSNASVTSAQTSSGLRFTKRKGPHEYDEEQYKKITFTRTRASGWLNMFYFSTFVFFFHFYFW